MTLYRHIPSKEDLIDLMLDTIVAEQDLGGLPTGNWIHDLTRIGHQQRAVRLRHPWSVVPPSRPPIGPHALRRMETALSVFPDDVPIQRRAWAITVIDAYVHGDASAELAERMEGMRTGLDKGQWQRAVASYLTKTLAAGDLPQLAAYMTANTASHRDENFTDGLRAVISGIQAALTR
ncbi:hypothetical protein C5N14_12565 [Micromonospora sp. MW-13]|nr:hypothetical protein C5N14_12565 [Micromonospora sp. MW-13]